MFRDTIEACGQNSISSEKSSKKRSLKNPHKCYRENTASQPVLLFLLTINKNPKNERYFQIKSYILIEMGNCLQYCCFTDRTEKIYVYPNIQHTQ